jgi:hypothetical protein
MYTGAVHETDFFNPVLDGPANEEKVEDIARRIERPFRIVSYQIAISDFPMDKTQTLSDRLICALEARYKQLILFPRGFHPLAKKFHNAGLIKQTTFPIFDAPSHFLPDHFIDETVRQGICRMNLELNRTFFFQMA